MGGPGTGSGAMFWTGIAVLVAVVAGGGWVVFWARRATWSMDDAPSEGFSLEDLRRMMERGQISKREFETARDALVHRTREAARKERDLRGGTDWGGSAEQAKPPRR